MQSRDLETQLVQQIAAAVVSRLRSGSAVPGAGTEPSGAPAAERWPAPGAGLVPGTRLVPVAISARHVHLSPEHVAVLFGAGYRLRVHRWLSQPYQYAADETVTLAGPRGCLQRVRILGPPRGATQVEVAYTDAHILGIRPPVRDSGDHRDTPGLTLVGPRGAVNIPQGVIVAARHLHLHPDEAAALGVGPGQRVRVRTGAGRRVLFDDVLCRVSPDFRLEMHIDTDEGNAAGLGDGDTVEIVERE